MHFSIRYPVIPRRFERIDFATLATSLPLEHYPSCPSAPSGDGITNTSILHNYKRSLQHFINSHRQHVSRIPAIHMTSPTHACISGCKINTSLAPSSEYSIQYLRSLSTMTNLMPVQCQLPPLFPCLSSLSYHTTSADISALHRQ